MRFDIEDVLSHAFGRGVACVLFFTSAIWIGSMIGGLACLIDDERSLNILTADLFQLLLSPRLLISLWITPNVIFLAIMLMRMFVKEEGMNHMTWGIVMGMESLFVMLGHCLDLSSGPRNSFIAWSCWLLFLGMAGTGIRLHCQMRRNRWVREMTELSAENAMLRAQRAAAAAAADAEAVEGPDLK